MMRVPPTKHMKNRMKHMNAAPPKSGCIISSPHSTPVTAKGGMTPTLKDLACTSSCFLRRRRPGTRPGRSWRTPEGCSEKGPSGIQRRLPPMTAPTTWQSTRSATARNTHRYVWLKKKPRFTLAQKIMTPVPTSANNACFLKNRYLSPKKRSAMMPELEKTMMSPNPASSRAENSSQKSMG
jgi:hypothetical protein